MFIVFVSLIGGQVTMGLVTAFGEQQRGRIMGSTRRLAASMLASAIYLGSQQSALAGGGDFIGGAIVGGILGTLLNQGLAHGETASQRRVAPPPRRTVMNPMELQYWRTIQQGLNAVGIDVGVVDGIPGNRTRLGVKAFQARIGSQPSGRLTQSDYQALMNQAGFGGGPSATDAPLALRSGGAEQATQDESSFALDDVPANDGVMSLAPVAKLPAAAKPSDTPAAATQSSPIATSDEDISPVVSLAPKALLADSGTPSTPPGESALLATKPDASAETVTSVPAAQSKIDTSTSVLDSLKAPPAKPLEEADIDAFSKKSAILGLHLGDSAKTAQDALANAVGSCSTAGSLTECSATGAAYDDQVKMASAGDGDAPGVYYLARKVTLARPVPKATVVVKLSETLKDVVEQPLMLIATPSACQAALSAGAQAVIEAFAKQGQSAADAFTLLQGNCRAFFTVDIPVKDELATGFTITLFDGRILPRPQATSPAETASTSRNAAPSVSIPTELKF